MTIDEALSLLAAPGPSGSDWRSFREDQEFAKGMVCTLSGPLLADKLERVLEVLHACNDASIQEALAAAVVRAAVELKQPARFANLAAQATLQRPFLQGLLTVARQGLDVWPLVETLESLPITRSELTAHVGALLALHPALESERFERLASRSPTLALQVALEQASWNRLPLGSLREPLITLAEDVNSPHRLTAVKALRRDPERFEASQVERLEAMVSAVPLDLAAAGVELVVVQWLRANRRDLCEPWLDHARLELRRAAFEGLLSQKPTSPSDFPRLVRALLDSDVELMTAAARALREHLLPRAASPEELTLLLAHAADTRVATLLAWLCTQHPVLRADLEHVGPLKAALGSTATRTCTRCITIPHSARWSHLLSAPTALSSLERVVVLSTGEGDTSTLLRCPECMAHFLLTDSVEEDANSRHESTGLSRLTLEALRTRYAAHVDFTHPRVASWADALAADASHVDPAVRAEAEWELA